jgi:hypothetical protein
VKKVLLALGFVLGLSGLIFADGPVNGGGVIVNINTDTTTATVGNFTTLNVVNGTASTRMTSAASTVTGNETVGGTLGVTGTGSAADTFTFSKGISSSSGTFTNLNVTYNMKAASATITEITGKITVDDTITGSKGANLSSATITNANITYNLNAASVTTSEVTGKTTFDDTATFSKGIAPSTGVFSGAVSVVGFTNSGTSTMTGPGGIVNTYGMTGSSIALTNSGYAVEIASAATSTAKMYIGGAFATLPTTGFPVNTFIVLTTDHKLYISSETVAGAYSWVAQ